MADQRWYNLDSYIETTPKTTCEDREHGDYATTADIGLIGLAVMGENLVLNMESHGFTVAVFNRTTSQGRRLRGGASQGKEDRRHALGRRSWSPRSRPRARS